MAPKSKEALAHFARNEEIQENLSQIQADHFAYPWNGLEAFIQKAKLPVMMIGYGSLLNPKSASRTITDTPEEGHLPAVAWGARRLFNYRMPPAALAHYGVDNSSGTVWSALNAIWTGDRSDIINGRVIQLARSDLDPLREREFGYDLMPVCWLPWNNWDCQLGLGFVLCATKASGMTDDSATPFAPYYEVCRNGAAMVGADFERLFLETTYSADGSHTLYEEKAK